MTSGNNSCFVSIIWACDCGGEASVLWFCSCWCSYYTANSHDSPEAEGIAVDRRNGFYNNQLCNSTALPFSSIEFGRAHLFGEWAGGCFIWVHAKAYKLKVRQRKTSPFTEIVISTMNPIHTEYLQPNHSLEITYKPHVYVWETWVRTFFTSKY